MLSVSSDPGFLIYIEGVELHHLKQLRERLGGMLSDDWNTICEMGRIHRHMKSQPLGQPASAIPPLRDRILHDRKGGGVIGLVGPTLDTITLPNMMLPDTLAIAIDGMELHRVLGHPLTEPGTMGHSRRIIGHSCSDVNVATPTPLRMRRMTLGGYGPPPDPVEIKVTTLLLDGPIMPLLTDQ